MRIKTLESFGKYSAGRIRERDSKSATVISVCCGTGCVAGGGREVLESFQKEIKEKNLNVSFDTLLTGCHGFCERGPLVVIHPEGTFYQQVKKEDVPEIIASLTNGRKPVERLLYVDPVSGAKVQKEQDVSFYKHQRRLIFASNGRIDPTNIDDYISIGGYCSLAKALKTAPEELIEQIKKSGLRGRGGAGFTTGRKWELCRNSVTLPLSPHSNATASTKYIICNADEGDPGAFMDRSLLEGNPHSIIEGMIIGAWAIGGKKEYNTSGYIYVRNEYPLAVKHLSIAIEQAKDFGFLGKNILGSGFDFDIKLSRGAGAFVCGEETALMKSVEGFIGEPNPRPPYPAQCGLFKAPTNINNVKTWASVPLIIKNGADWYSSIGTQTSKGTMIFSLVGKINNTGLIEVPMGITLREIVYNIGGGIPKGKKFKAIQTGGPSGGCLPESLLDLPIDYESLTSAGSMMGSGGMIVMDEDTCMVDTARYFLAFTQDESCGKCTPCREGTKHMLDILTRITEGKGTEEDLDLLSEMGGLIKQTSLCALGGTAPNPVLTTLKYFRNEYEAHIREKKCPAKVCKPLIKYTILDKCNGCHVCFKQCPQMAITGDPKKVHAIIQEKCIKCGICFDVCKFDSVKVE
ncbi:MAG: NADH-quinone oxidoreductase subunit NuoF [Elusimicrobiota bacterium]